MSKASEVDFDLRRYQDPRQKSLERRNSEIAGKKGAVDFEGVVEPDSSRPKVISIGGPETPSASFSDSEGEDIASETEYSDGEGKGIGTDVGEMSFDDLFVFGDRRTGNARSRSASLRTVSFSEPRTPPSAGLAHSLTDQHANVVFLRERRAADHHRAKYFTQLGIGGQVHSR